ncbi:hypothetical protein R3P38DRAFT_2901418 [Favolaschia claudopus]|uniref:Uncharacterized protein n=1 Tax=Favolaschia claudopus TaxID=2862362 RepID=A0AAW0CL18_9AGAR
MQQRPQDSRKSTPLVAARNDAFRPLSTVMGLCSFIDTYGSNGELLPRCHACINLNHNAWHSRLRLTFGDTGALVCMLTCFSRSRSFSLICTRRCLHRNSISQHVYVTTTPHHTFVTDGKCCAARTPANPHLKPAIPLFLPPLCFHSPRPQSEHAPGIIMPFDTNTKPYHEPSPPDTHPKSISRRPALSLAPPLDNFRVKQ